MARTAYLDESYDKDKYVMASLAVDPASVAAVRSALRGVAPKKVVRRHMVKEGDAERHKLLDTFKALPGCEVHVWFETRGGTAVRRRQRALRGLVGELLTGGVRRLFLDHVAHEQQKLDRLTIYHASQAFGSDVEPAIDYSHLPAHSTEPMLWVPDAVAWCARRPDRWRRELDGWAVIHRR